MAAKSKASVNYREAPRPSRSCAKCVMGKFALNATVGTCVNKDGSIHVAGTIHKGDTCDDFYAK